MKLIIEWEMNNSGAGKVTINIPKPGKDADRYIRKLSTFTETVNRLNENLKSCGAVVRRRIQK